MKKWLMALCGLLLGCGGVPVEQYRDEKPTLDLRAYFTGQVDAWGMFQKRNGEVVRRFHVVIQGRSEGEKLILEEDFHYSDGSKQRRVWTLTPTGPNRWSGKADDVIGDASGEVAGNALRWRYVLSLPVDGKIYHVDFDDWMYLLDADTLANRSFMSKWGFELGQVTLFFRKAH